MTDRKQSPLLVNPANPLAAPPPPVPAPAQPEKPAPEPPAPRADRDRVTRPAKRRDRAPVVPTQAGGDVAGRRRKRHAGPLEDTDLVSFNCKLTLVCRRRVALYAATFDVDKQDVVERALVEFLIARGVDPEEIPLRPGAPDLPALPS